MTDEQLYRLFLIVNLIIHAVISFLYVRRAGAGSTIFQHREEGALLALGIAVCYVAFVIAVLAYCANPAWTAWATLGISRWLRWLGAILLVVGAAWAIWSLHHLGGNLHPRRI